MAKGIKDEPYSGKSKDIDLEEFRAILLEGVEDPRVQLSIKSNDSDSTTKSPIA